MKTTPLWAALLASTIGIVADAAAGENAIGFKEEREPPPIVNVVSAAKPLEWESVLDGSMIWYKVRLGSWECAVPEKTPDTNLVCTKGKRIVVYALDDSEGFNVGVPLDKTNRRGFLTLTDKDNNGSYDGLGYDGLSETGEVNKLVFDDNLDGNIDRILDFKKARISVRIDDKWIELEEVGRDDKGLVIYKGNVNGSAKRVIFSSYPYQIVDLPKPTVGVTQPK